MTLLPDPNGPYSQADLAHPRFEELVAVAKQWRMQAGELEGEAELHAVVDVVGYLKWIGESPYRPERVS